MPTLNLTARGLKALAPQNNRLDYWDESLPGFGVRVTPDGRKTFCVMYRHAGRKRRHTLGTHPPLSLSLSLSPTHVTSRARRSATWLWETTQPQRKP
jgi:hypothetical protein